eukprot:gnl/MRDRNA2_/MRDRNA2_65015_c0_seq1.p1 gnl/MRDRNA2_/MRDRNA2_65015_c0~~gnl/MRDRNA2_/MRDRNA2_65015_c0_seq1.p1  ORF type:complete len:344 (+),score=54.23 gnl/MRDRNA2_/MRDRNA2_65015_c0_seq1:135-1166(+)
MHVCYTRAITKLLLMDIIFLLSMIASLGRGVLRRSPGKSARQCGAKVGFAQLVCGCKQGLQIEQVPHLLNRTEVVYSPAGEAPGGEWLSISVSTNESSFTASSNQSHRAAIVTSVGYADKLEVSLLCNVDLFDEIVVATAPDDSATLAVCNTFSSRRVWCYRTTAFHHGDAAFNKGAAVREVQRKLHKDAVAREGETLIAIVDADVCLPKAANVPSPPQGTLIGLRGRWVVPTMSDMLSGSPAFLEVFREPTGFFQLYNARAPRLYPAYLPTAGGSDQLFAMSFDHQQILPAFAWMLGCPYVNWAGVKTADWASMSAGSALQQKISAVNQCFGCEDAVHTLLD